MSDMEQEWKPKGRPQSTMAQAFSSTLDSVFALDSDVDHLSQTIDQKRFKMIIQTRELEELQAKIRETERRLKARQSLIVDGSGSRNSAGAPKVENEYRTAGLVRNVESSTSTATSPTDSAGQYSSSDEQREQDRNRNS
ncbi:hypothetical protein CNMCM8980_009134 [Aspergillus fumigatiaffinis]|uniref:Uncharacterized protein n=1 Tax=Aspergillus fumigatiaffinis TaxID=340414 RepID=A0A8H4GWS8_9EURO|nr:hypothetical protein CNMCM5878_001213 [Aspergillus fumigatiaffinis]KAF4223042.1 hypothetical protein CNMCM6457_000809 [Aspergillus fumigatiaffinis]KAF4230151.1 hypothetical protein CNMCM6805_000972 [Aspergillus fumigatiaffinis]KAF4246014.1 hypothetical protein CNMCM8980_009134 [Aspergillus fumigatiaffinis]